MRTMFRIKYSAKINTYVYTSLYNLVASLKHIHQIGKAFVTLLLVRLSITQLSHNIVRTEKQCFLVCKYPM